MKIAVVNSITIFYILINRFFAQKRQLKNSILSQEGNVNVGGGRANKKGAGRGRQDPAGPMVRGNGNYFSSSSMRLARKASKLAMI